MMYQLLLHSSRLHGLRRAVLSFWSPLIQVNSSALKFNSGRAILHRMHSCLRTWLNRGLSLEQKSGWWTTCYRIAWSVNSIPDSLHQNPGGHFPGTERSTCTQVNHGHLHFENCCRCLEQLSPKHLDCPVRNVLSRLFQFSICVYVQIRYQYHLTVCCKAYKQC